MFSTKDDDLEMKQLSTEHFFNKNSQEIDLKTATKQRSNYTLLTAGLFDQTYCRILNIHFNFKYSLILYFVFYRYKYIQNDTVVNEIQYLNVLYLLSNY